MLSCSWGLPYKWTVPLESGRNVCSLINKICYIILSISFLFWWLVWHWPFFQLPTALYKCLYYSTYIILPSVIAIFLLISSLSIMIIEETQHLSLSITIPQYELKVCHFQLNLALLISLIWEISVLVIHRSPPFFFFFLRSKWIVSFLLP